MKQRGLPPWDLTASVLIAASALAFSMFSSDRVASPLGSLLFVLVLLLPGYLLSIIIFPRRYEIAGKGRLAISIGMDVILVLLLSLGLSLSSWGLHLSSLAASAAIIVLVLAVIAHLNRSALPIWNRFVPIVSGSGRSPSRQRQEGAISISRRTIAALFALAATVVLVAVAYTAINAYTTINTNDAEINMDETGDVGDARFTEFYILGEKDEAHPTPVRAGKMIATTAGIINHEHRAVNYTLMLALNGALLLQKEIKLNHNQSWEGVVDYVLENSGSWQRLDFLLYKEGDFSLPYSEDHLWFNVSSEATPASQNSSDASENGTTALQKMSKVVVLGIKDNDKDNDEDESNDKKRNSDSNKASQKTVPQPSQIAVKLQGEDHTEQFTLHEMESDLVETFDQVDEGISVSPKDSSRELAEQSSLKDDEGSGDIRSKDISIPESRSIESDIKETGSLEGDEKLVATAVVLETDALKLDSDKPLDKSETETLNEGNSKSENSKIDDSRQNDFEMDNPGQSKQEVDNPKAEAPKVEPFEVNLPKLELTKVEPPKAEPPKEKPPKVAPPEIRPPKFEPTEIKLPKVTAKVDTTKVDTTKVVTSKLETPKVDTTKLETSKVVTSKSEIPKVVTSKSETSKVDDPKKDTSKMDNSDADNSEISEPAAASGDSNSLAGTGEAKGPAKNDPETEQKDSKSSSTSADNKDDASVSEDVNSVSQKEEAEEVSEMDSEINSWVGTRGFSKSDKSQSFKSKNIKYVKKGDSVENAILGSQSKTPVRVGR